MASPAASFATLSTIPASGWGRRVTFALQARHLHVDLAQRLLGLGGIAGRKHELAIEFVEVCEQVVDRPRARLAVDHDLIRLEIGLDRGARDFRRRIAGLALGLHRQIDRLAAAVPDRLAAFQRVLLGLVGEHCPGGGLGRSRVSAVSSRMDSKISRIGDVGAEAALSLRYFGLSLSSGFSWRLLIAAVHAAMKSRP